MARIKIGAFTGFTSKDGVDIKAGDEVQHSITGVSGVVNAYGQVVNTDGSGTNRLSNDVWVVTKPYSDTHPTDKASTPEEDQEEKSIRIQLFDTKVALRSAEQNVLELSKEVTRLKDELQEANKECQTLREASSSCVDRKPLEGLTWEDAEKIVETSDNLIDNIGKKQLLRYGREGFYTLVLQCLTSAEVF